VVEVLGSKLVTLVRGSAGGHVHGDFHHRATSTKFLSALGRLADDATGKDMIPR
jgi:hypothetical protein